MSDIDISFRKSQAQFSLYYKDVPQPDVDVCESFMEELKKSPMKIVEGMRDAAKKAGYDDQKGFEGVLKEIG